MRIRLMVVSLTLIALSPGCALPARALHNIRVEMRENLDEHLEGVREWWHREPVGVPTCSPESIGDSGSEWFSGRGNGGVVEGPPVLPPPSLNVR